MSTKQYSHKIDILLFFLLVCVCMVVKLIIKILSIHADKYLGYLLCFCDKPTYSFFKISLAQGEIQPWN